MLDLKLPPRARRLLPNSLQSLDQPIRRPLQRLTIHHNTEETPPLARRIIHHESSFDQPPRHLPRPPRCDINIVREYTARRIVKAHLQTRRRPFGDEHKVFMLRNLLGQVRSDRKSAINLSLEPCG